ncbi:MAG: hypothetical protein KDC48_01355 [Planctomycetes bacterium]|nr:hypothetical protein [Planctomycetota bacterium]
MRTVLVGLVCIAPLATLLGQMLPSLALMVTAGVGYLVLERFVEHETDGPVEPLLPAAVERLVRYLLIAAGTAMACLSLACAAIPFFPAVVRTLANENAAKAPHGNLATTKTQPQHDPRLDRDADGKGGNLAERR